MSAPHSYPWDDLPSLFPPLTTLWWPCYNLNLPTSHHHVAFKMAALLVYKWCEWASPQSKIVLQELIFHFWGLGIWQGGAPNLGIRSRPASSLSSPCGMANVSQCSHLPGWKRWRRAWIGPLSCRHNLDLHVLTNQTAYFYMLTVTTSRVHPVRQLDDIPGPERKNFPMPQDVLWLGDTASNPFTSLAPQGFSKYSEVEMEMVLALLWERCVSILTYIDRYLILTMSLQEVKAYIVLGIQYITQLHFAINPNNCALQPSQHPLVPHHDCTSGCSFHYGWSGTWGMLRYAKVGTSEVPAGAYVSAEGAATLRPATGWRVMSYGYVSPCLLPQCSLPQWDWCEARDLNPCLC